MRRGKVYLIGAAFLWGTLGLAASVAIREGMKPESISFFRAFIGSLIGMPLVRRKALDRRLIFLGLTFTGPLYLSYIYSVKYSGIGLAAALLYLAPAIVVILSPAFLGEMITLKKGVAVALATAGAVLTQVKGGRFVPDPLGIFFGLLSAVSYAGIIMYVRRLVRSGYDPLHVGIAPQLWAALELLPFSEFHLSFVSLISVTYLGVFTAALAYILQAKGLERMDAGSASIISTIEPLVALVIGLLIGEGLQLEEILGALMIILASALV